MIISEAASLEQEVYSKCKDNLPKYKLPCRTAAMQSKSAKTSARARVHECTGTREQEFKSSSLPIANSLSGWFAGPAEPMLWCGELNLNRKDLDLN